MYEWGECVEKKFFCYADNVFHEISEKGATWKTEGSLENLLSTNLHKIQMMQAQESI